MLRDFKRNMERIQKAIDMVRYFQKTSSPFLSQDTFKRLSDLNLDSSNTASVEQLKSARIIFCDSGYVESFLDTYGKNVQAKVLIFGNNDVNFHDFPYRLPKSVKRVYLQNSSISDGYFSTLPIGLENLSYFRHGLPRLVEPKFANKIKNGMALVGPFGLTHEDRRSLIGMSFQKHPNVRFLNKRMSPTHYAKISSNYSFIFCPRGNGIDTHRFWEVLYRGSLPVVIKSNWSDSIAQLGIPFLAVKSWDEALYSEAYQLGPHPGLNPRLVQALWEPYWIDEIRKLI
jgi:hypothetical protein